METTPIQRRLTVAACVLMAAIAGSLIALAGARFIALALAQTDVTDYAGDLLARAAMISTEANNSLAAANELSAIPCSPDDITKLRSIAFKTRFVKDVGRLIGGKLVCSSFLGVLSAPVDGKSPDFVAQSFQKLWSYTPLQLAPDVNAMVAEAGVSNVVIDPAAFLDLEHPPFRYSIAIVNPQTKVVLRSWGKRLISDATMIAGDAAFENATDLISVRCSDAYAICAVAALDRSQALSRQSPFIYGFIGFGAVAGGLLALATMWRGEATSFARLKRAMQADELTVVYQPIIDLNSARMISAEALVRWTDRTGKVIAPDVFVAAAEEAGTAGEITAYVLKKVSAKAGAFLRQNPDFRITVNIVTADLDDARFYEALKGAVGTAGISPRQIGLELTERSAASLDVAGPAIARLRKLGHLVYLDDFGTGYSSLANLQELNVDIIKIDRAFTKTVGTASVKVSIVPQILDMAIALKLGVVIEGIETQEQFDYFANATPSCAGQGWLISRPLTLRQLVAFHQQNASK